MSIADVGQSGGFSTFLGYRRIITLLEGAGMQPPFDYREDLAQPTQAVIRQLLQAMLDWGRERYGR